MFKVEFDGGRLSGCERYYRSLVSARRVCSRYVNDSIITLSDHFRFCDLYEVDSNYHLHLICTYSNV